jgi:Asp-tRNA(Asn)/Glu-tRNA(Gln) amidotransferase A subunit family amidase
MTDAAMLTATEAARRIRDGRLSPAALLEACLDRIAADEGRVRAFAHLDAEAVRHAKVGEGPLRGLPIGVKDVLDTADMTSEYGSLIWAGYRPRADAASVAWARAAGGVVLGKTVTTEFATRKPGPTTNPTNPAHTPGGSSSGSAAGVAAGFFPLAFGTQTAGSIIRPAAFCGVVGFKPSFGSIPRLGMKVMSDNLDTIGVMARSVADCALFAGAVSGRDLGDPDQLAPRPPRIGLCRSHAWEHAAPETVVLWDQVIAALDRADATLSDCELPDEFRALETAHPVVMNAESARSMGWEMMAHREQISEVLRERLEWGLSRSTDELDAALATFTRLQGRMGEVMEGLDVLVTPSAPGEAPLGLEWTGDPVFNATWTALRVPCVTVPAGSGPNGLPLGIQIVGRTGDDRATLAWAQFVAAALA